MKNLIDGDVVRYRAGFSVESATHIEPIENCLHNVRNLVDAMQGATGASENLVILSGRTNYRKDIYPEYKANRPDRKPVYFDQITEYLKYKYPTVVTDWVEADDMLGILQTEDTIICTIDKDLDMIPGWHYNFVKGDFYCMDQWDCTKFFYTQLLTGDRVDNIPGLAGIGPAKAAKYLEGCESEEELYTVVRAAYDEHGHDEEYMRLQADLLWILQKPFTPWEPMSNE